MTLIEDMSETERQSWMTLLVDGAVFMWFVQKMTVGFGTKMSVNDFTPEGLMSIYLGVIIITIVLHIIIASVFALREAKDHTAKKDERDIFISRKGAAYGFAFLAIALNIIVFQYLFEHTIPDYQGPYSLKNVSHMFFALLSLTFIGDIVKNAVMVLAYRGE